MAQIIRSLDELTSGYTVFEKDQVLTASQLNSIAEYFGDQIRLDRSQLNGIGIICGLKTGLPGRTVRLSKGLGLTADGDLLMASGDIVYDRFQPYDEKNPRYDSFFDGEKMIPLFELVEKGAKEKRALPLSQFTEASGYKLSSALAILYMESYLFDPDLCSGSDCDNLGQEFRNRQRLLLTDREFLGFLNPGVLAPSDVYDSFEEVLVSRPQLSAAIKTENQFSQQFRQAAENIHAQLVKQFSGLYSGIGMVVSDLFPADPAKVWLDKLEDCKAHYRRDDTGIQYYYDFLKDLSLTYNYLLELVSEDSAICTPSNKKLSKHLILGTLARAGDDDPDRTGFYPSMSTQDQRETRAHLRFLYQKLNTLIAAFQFTDSANADIRITPGLSELHCLEEQAIPYYYPPSRIVQAHRFWNFRYHSQNKDAYNYSYHATSYNARGGASNPFGSRISQFDFFRIEGHLGKPVAAVHAFIEAQIKSFNLPFNSRSVMLSEDHGRLVIKPGFFFSDLHKLHNLMRYDVVNQLDEVKRYSGGLKTQVLQNLDILDPEDRGTFKEIAESRDSELNTSVEMASVKLRGSFAEYTKENTANDSWKQHLSNTMQLSGNFKGQLSTATKNEFSTPFDSLISNRHLDVLDHLDELIKFDNEKRQKRLLFSNYINEHCGLEHTAGVLRGGTFVVLYNENGIVVGDVMLPYMESDVEKLDDMEPPLNIRPIRPGFVIDKGLNLLSPIDKRIRGRLNDFKANELDGLLTLKAEGIKNSLDNSWTTRFSDQQRDYFNTIKESFGTVSNVLIKQIGIDKDLLGNMGGIKDLILGKSVNNMKSMREVMAAYKAKSEIVDDPAEKQKFLDLAGQIEMDLSDTITEVTQQVANTNQEITLGSDGYNALLEINQVVSALNSAPVIEKVNQNITQLSGSGRPSSFNLMIGNILRK
ncbi:MAG: hypothetical protein IPH88_13500 [Bacteroidales bacterium]|nr:hypothetical protein [Bacteroidales bacterium]